MRHPVTKLREATRTQEGSSGGNEINGVGPSCAAGAKGAELPLLIKLLMASAAVKASFRTSWSALLEHAKVTRFGWHDLRHHFASRLVQAGVPLNTFENWWAMAAWR
jgi:hypothetical protein